MTVTVAWERPGGDGRPPYGTMFRLFSVGIHNSRPTLMSAIRGAGGAATRSTSGDRQAGATQLICLSAGLHESFYSTGLAHR